MGTNLLKMPSCTPVLGEPAAHEASWGPQFANFARHSQKSAHRDLCLEALWLRISANSAIHSQKMHSRRSSSAVVWPMGCGTIPSYPGGVSEPMKPGHIWTYFLFFDFCCDFWRVPGFPGCSGAPPARTGRRLIRGTKQMRNHHICAGFVGSEPPPRVGWYGPTPHWPDHC